MNKVLLVLVLFCISCHEVEEENVWDDLTAAEKVIVENLARDKCIGRNQANFDAVETRIGSDMIDNAKISVGDYFTFEYVEKKKGYDDDDYSNTENWIFSLKVKAINTSSKEITFLLKKVDQENTGSTTVVEFTHDTDDAALGTYWGDLLTESCTPSDDKNLNEGNTNIGLIQYDIVQEDVQSDYEINSTENRYVYADRPFFLEFFFKKKLTSKLVTDKDDDDYNKTSYTEETWTLITDETFTETSGTACGPINDDANYSACFSF